MSNLQQYMYCKLAALFQLCLMENLFSHGIGKNR